MLFANVDYQQTLDYLYAQLPMFTRIGAAAYKKDLTNTLALCDLLGNPQHTFKTIHIAGTNGKGSTSHMLAAILQSAGYKTGLYTSPHLIDFRERIRVNGQLIPKEKVMDFVQRYQSDFERIQPSFFEWTVALCFDYFAGQGVDIAIIETGLGGRLDSTNVIHPVASVITNIGWDHMDMLGDTLPKIAFEKAGILKQHAPAVIGEYHEDTMPVFTDKANSTHSRLVMAFDEYRVTAFTPADNGGCKLDVYKQDSPAYLNLMCDLGGYYQQKNVVTVLAAVDVLRQSGFEISEQQVRQGIANTRSLTELMGRWQILNNKPLTICDTGHNKNGIEWVMKQLADLPAAKCHIVWGMVRDKDISAVLNLLPRQAQYYFCNAQLPRALPANELADKASEADLKGGFYNTVKDAYIAAQHTAEPHDVIFIGGSTFVVAELLTYLSE